MQTVKIGVLGGGQLAKMFIQSAVNYPVHITCMDADAEAPGLQMAHTRIAQSVQDYDAVIAAQSISRQTSIPPPPTSAPHGMAPQLIRPKTKPPPPITTQPQHHHHQQHRAY